ncbi:MAG: Rrf2 family transcriptional regulator [Moraxellaceae bacterium]|nr:Rrf2 family transcriptional regulator [Pseudobdellovibrionaceae bacterium]
MNKINKKTEYALMALKYFVDQAVHESPVGLISAKDLAEKTHTPFEVIARVLQALSSRGILKAEYGVSGGYQLVKNLEDISVYELMNVLENSSELAKCLGSDSECELSSKCNIISPMTHLNSKVQNFYKSISLAEVLYV